MIIRPYTPDDWDRVCQIHDAARRDELAAAGLDAAYLTLEQTAHNEGFHDYTVRVADAGGTVMGFVAFTTDELAWLYVDPAAYGMGVGTSLDSRCARRDRRLHERGGARRERSGHLRVPEGRLRDHRQRVRSHAWERKFPGLGHRPEAPRWHASSKRSRMRRRVGGVRIGRLLLGDFCAQRATVATDACKAVGSPPSNPVLAARLADQRDAEPDQEAGDTPHVGRVSSTLSPGKV